MDSTTQVSRMLKAFRASRNGIENYRFPAMGILRYSARIADLRAEGFEIVAERVYSKGRWTGVWKYRLVEERPKPTLMQKLKQAIK